MTDNPAPLPPGAVIGILGGGQLGRMLATAAIELGFRCHVFAPETDSPAFDAARFQTVANYGDQTALTRFAANVDVVTYEFENVPAAAVACIDAIVPIRPGAKALAIAQDRLAEKEFATSLGAETAQFRPVDVEGDLAGVDFGGPKYVLKTRRLGYDGKGQAIVETAAAAAEALAGFGGAPCILEAFVPFTREISVVLARGVSGEIAAFEPGENTHRDHILARTCVPAALSEEARDRAIAIAARFTQALDYVGVLAIEFFVTGEPGHEGLLVNEIAPRVHNSGHWTSDGASVSQFEQHIRAITGWPLAAPATLAPTTMENLIGHEVDAWPRLAADPGARLHLYGKSETRPGRKMGHVNRRP